MLLRQEISLSNLSHNIQILTSYVPRKHVAPVLKGDAHGMGIETVLPTLISAGYETFFVATIDEGARIRKHTSKGQIFVLSDDWMERLQELRSSLLIPVVNTEEEFAFVHKTKIPFALHLNTVMYRLGLSEEQWNKIKQSRSLFEEKRLKLLMTHIGSVRTSHEIEKAYRQFLQMTEEFKDVPRSFGASCHIGGDPKIYMDRVRVGSFLLGSNVEHYQHLGGRPLVNLKTRILEIIDIPPGTSIGYDRRPMQRQTRAAIIGVGTQMGIPAFHIPEAYVLWNENTPCPFYRAHL